MFRSGGFVAEHISPAWYDGEEDMEVSPNGVDLTLAEIGKVDEGRLVMTRDSKFEPRVDAEERVHLEPEDTMFELKPGYYRVRYGETIEIPMGHVGFVYPRSTLMRNGLMLYSAVWDAGYEGKGVGGLAVSHRAEIQKGTRIGQIVMARAEDSSGEYDGQYQGEGVVEKM